MRFARGNDRIYLNKEERINVYSSSVHVSRLASIGIAVKLKNFEKDGSFQSFHYMDGQFYLIVVMVSL